MERECTYLTYIHTYIDKLRQLILNLRRYGRTSTTNTVLYRTLQVHKKWM